MTQMLTTMTKMLRIARIAALLFSVGVTLHSFAQSRVVQAQVHSSGLEHNLFGDSPDQTVGIYLPAAYAAEPQRRFAVIYFLHGYTDTPAVKVAEIVQQMIDKQIAAHTVEPMIVVAPNGLNKLLGSFYTNSSATGDWEDYVVRDVVAYVDSHYRTLASPDSRGIGGHSMGGYGSLMLAFKHPDIFGYVYAMSPCCTILAGDLGLGSKVWEQAQNVKSASELPGMIEHGDLLSAAVFAAEAAFAPDPRKPFPFSDSPVRREGNHWAPDPEVFPEFQSHIVVNAVPSLLPKIYKLKGIYIDYGAQDEYTHIPLGAQALSSELSAAGIPHMLDVYEGTHSSRVHSQFETKLLPWFSAHLKQ
jgi:S-formylglutathione hydrolase